MGIWARRPCHEGLAIQSFLRCPLGVTVRKWNTKSKVLRRSLSLQLAAGDDIA